MIKLVIVQCVRSFNDKTEVGKLYRSHPSKSGNDRVFLDNGESVVISALCKITMYRSVFSRYFKVVDELHLSSFTECKKYAEKSIAELLDIMEEQPYSLRKSK